MKKKKTSTQQDPTWDHCTKVEDSRMHLRCNYCGVQRWGGVFRMKQHFAGTHSNVAECPQCPEEVKRYFQNFLGKKESANEENVEYFEGGNEDEIVIEKGKAKPCVSYVVKEGKGKVGSKQRTLNEIVKNREPVIRDICRFFYGNAIAFNVVKSPLFKQMLKSVGEYGRGLKPPSYHETRVTYLKKEVLSVHESLEKYKKEWKKTGCTLMSDGWTDGKSRSLTNFLVNSPSGTVFLKSLDTSSYIKDADKLFELLDSMVEEIGEENVVQVVTDSASAYVAAGRKLEEKRKCLFWSPCAAHLMDLMLSDIGELPIFHDTIRKAKEITVYIYRHTWVLDMYRRYTKKRELTRAGVTRFATAFLTLKSFEENKLPLRHMFASEEWAKGPFANKFDAKHVENIILGDAKFWKAIKYCLKCVIPLVKVLRLLDGDSKPAMGYVYEAMDRAKEQIASNFGHKKQRYGRIWKIIDTRWDLQLHRPLHAAGYYLNPRFHFGEDFNADKEVKRGLYETIERMCPDIETRITVSEQLEKFRNSAGMFGMSMATLTRSKTQPALWWESYGEDVPELQKVAMRVLSLTCSATGCERNWSTFDNVHSKKRNRLEQQRLDALVFVKYNIQLEMRHEKRKQNGETYDPICLSDMESDDEWITEKEDPCLPQDQSWMDIHECFQDEGTSKKRKRGPRILNADKRGKKVVVDDDVEVIDDDDEEDEEEIEEEEQRIVVEDYGEDDDDDDLNLDDHDDE